ncbi:hypothetical protein B0I35DRAFT_508923 [Stachybotrys elegans]|uniref:DUF8035 domain-containing protein n=1 Tax=Stachybotrys elegans TaxID=80388 RepID=A0A8K0WVK5_9HYPO|nr:hypothetical protein B0I35DRAFT_508923 [Stachybotrys elegans]
MSSYYDDDDELDIRYRRRVSPPQAVRYVERPAQRPHSYYDAGGPSLYVPETRTTIVARQPAPAQPVIINNRFYNDYSSSDDDDDRGNRRQRQVARRRRSRSRSRTRSRSRSRSGSSSHMSRVEWEAELARRELERMRLKVARDERERKMMMEREQSERRLIKEHEDETQLKNAKRELDELKRREAQAEEEKRIMEELELKRLKKEQEEAEELARLEKVEKEAIERYKQAELKRQAEERKRAEETEKEYKRRVQEDLINSGLDEKAIAAIMNKQKIPETAVVAHSAPADRPTYTRMARRHLSEETLRVYGVDYDLDQDPDYLIIKRWVPEYEQDQLWKHTKIIREKRTKLLMIEEKHHHHRHSHSSDFEWVRKKSPRHRSKSPSLLMYLAGGRPS